MSREPSAFRIAVFTHDAYGIGHVQRCLNIIKALAQRAPQAAILLITGSPPVDLFKSLPPNADYVKIPTIVTPDAQGTKPPMLAIGFAELSLLRRQLIQKAVLTFEPDVFLVDNFPLGSQRELLPILKELRSCSTRVILGLRDIADPPEKIKKDWSRDGIYEVLERYYDSILVYGMREVLDIEDAYALSKRLAAKVHYCGYVTSDAPPSRTTEKVREELGFEGPFILATVGGGGDGFPLLQAFLQALPLISIPAIVITGPLMSPSDRTRLQAMASGCAGVRVIEYVPDLPSYLTAAELVVSMAGYNTLAEILAQRCRAIVIPRTWYSGGHSNRERARVDLEQLVRAKALAQLGLVDLLEPMELSPERLAERITAAIAGPQVKPKFPANVRGLECTVNHILAMAKGKEGI